MLPLESSHINTPIEETFDSIFPYRSYFNVSQDISNYTLPDILVNKMPVSSALGEVVTLIEPSPLAEEYTPQSKKSTPQAL